MTPAELSDGELATALREYREAESVLDEAMEVGRGISGCQLALEQAEERYNRLLAAHQEGGA